MHMDHFCCVFLSMILKLPVPLFLTKKQLKKPIVVDVKGGEWVLATFVVIGIFLVTAVVPPVLLTWPTLSTSSPTKLQLNIVQWSGTFGTQQCSGCFRFHSSTRLCVLLAWLGYLSHKCPLESHIFHPGQNDDKLSRNMDNIIFKLACCTPSSPWALIVLHMWFNYGYLTEALRKLPSSLSRSGTWLNHGERKPQEQRQYIQANCLLRNLKREGLMRLSTGMASSL